MGWRNNDTMASVAKASLADGRIGPMAVVVVNCAAAVDAAATIPSLALMAVAKMPLLLPPLTATSIGNNFYRRCQRPPSPLLYSRGSTAAVFIVNGNSNGEGRGGQGWMRAQGQGHKGGGKGGGKGSKGGKGGKGGKGKGNGKGNKGKGSKGSKGGKGQGRQG